MNSTGPKSWKKRLGKKPAVPGAIKFALANYVNLDLPVPPDHFRHDTPPPWNDYANSDCGDCVFAGAANMTALWEHEGGLPLPPFDDESVVSAYSAVTGYDPADEDTDNGTNMADGFSYWRKTGLPDAAGKRHKIDAYAWVQLDNMRFLKASLWLLGAVGIGFMFPDYAMDQFYEGLWEVKDGDVAGGHFVPCVGIAENGNLICVSWGREVEMTPEFYREYADEVVGVIETDRLDKTTRLSPEGFNVTRLQQDLATVARGRVYALSSSPTNWA